MRPLEQINENNDDTQQIDYDSSDELLPLKKVKSFSFIQNNREQLVTLQVIFVCEIYYYYYCLYSYTDFRSFVVCDK